MRPYTIMNQSKHTTTTSIFKLTLNIPLKTVIHITCDTMLIAFLTCILIGHTLEKDRVKRKDDGMACFDDTRDLPIATVSTLTTILGSWPNRIWTAAVMISGITRLSIVPLILYKKLSGDYLIEPKIKPAFIAVCSCVEHLAVMGLVFLYWSPDYDSYMKLKNKQLKLDESNTGTILPSFEYWGHYIFLVSMRSLF